jgi:uncharacterized protein with GYD domain
MPTYIMLSNLTDAGAKTVSKKPNRIQEVNSELEKAGVKVLAQYATLGHYDFVNVVEADSNTTVAKASVKLASRGSIRITTLAAVDIEEFIRALAE